MINHKMRCIIKMTEIELNAKSTINLRQIDKEPRINRLL